MHYIYRAYLLDNETIFVSGIFSFFKCRCTVKQLLCECLQCYTLQGLELSRVTVVSSNLQVVYDTFVRPDNEVIDYNTR